MISGGGLDRRHVLGGLLGITCVTPVAAQALAGVGLAAPPPETPEDGV